MTTTFKYLILIGIFILGNKVSAQEFDLTVIVKNPATRQVNDPKIFREIEEKVADFFNKTKWTSDEFRDQEKIKGKVEISITEENGLNSFTATMIIQTERPIYNSDYISPMLNIQDNYVSFNFLQGQALIKTENSFVDNFSSILSFYGYMMLGFDYDSFELYGGDKSFATAREIFDGLSSGLKQTEGWQNVGVNGRSRYFFIENVLSPRLRPFRQINYEYHRLALDNMALDAEKNRAVILSSLGIIEDLSQAYPNNYLLQIFNDAKYKELVEIFKAGDQGQKAKLKKLMELTSLSEKNRFNDLK